MSRKLSQTTTCAENPPKPPRATGDGDRARQAVFVARAAARQRGLDLREFDIEALEQQDFYKVVFLPNDPQTIGGGLRVWVDKYELQVKQIVHLQ